MRTYNRNLMSPLAVGPIIALLGIVATFYLLRNKARVRKSMYRTLRDERERQLRHARERALAARSAAARATEAASAPAAASPAATAERASTAYVGVPTQEVQRPPAAAPEAVPAPPPPAPIQEPLPTQEVEYTPPVSKTEPAPEPAPEPVLEAEPEPEPEPEPVATEPMAGEAPAAPQKAGWEIVEPAPKDPVAAQREGMATRAGKAAWELDTTEREAIEMRHKKIKDKLVDPDTEAEVKESLAQTMLSYAGLVLALLVVLLGIIFMLGSRAT